MPSKEAKRAVAAVRERFPFPGYFDASPQGHAEIADVVLRHMKRGTQIVDVGAGPLDKTAVLAELGFRCTAVDDLSDPWHSIYDNREKILEFARQEGIDYRLVGHDPMPDGPFSMVMAHDIIEHLHDSPRELLLPFIGHLRPEGLLFVTVPNAANLRKRLALAAGRTNYPLYAHYFWETPWRGHVREYVTSDLRQLAQFLGLEVLEVRGAHHLAHRLPRLVRGAYLLATLPSDHLRDTLVLLARKQPGWQPIEAPSPEVAALIRAGASPYFTADA